MPLRKKIEKNPYSDGGVYQSEVGAGPHFCCDFRAGPGRLKFSGPGCLDIFRAGPGHFQKSDVNSFLIY